MVLFLVFALALFANLNGSFQRRKRGDSPGLTRMDKPSSFRYKSVRFDINQFASIQISSFRYKSVRFDTNQFVSISEGFMGGDSVEEFPSFGRWLHGL